MGFDPLQMFTNPLDVGTQKTQEMILRPVHTIRFKDPILGSENWKQVFRGSDFKVPCLW